MTDNILKADIKAHLGSEKFLCKVTWRNGVFVMDEPLHLGGQDKGPDPYTTLLASLAGCTVSTLRMYIDYKKWNVVEIDVQLNMWQEKEPELITYIKRDIHVTGVLSEEQRAKLLEIASKCPISRILEHQVHIKTSL